jgi:hypothetical protein
MSVVASNRFRAYDEETVLWCTLPGQAHMNTNPTVTFAFLERKCRFSLIYATKLLLIKTAFFRDKNSLRL